MNKSVRILVALAALGMAGLNASAAEPALKLLTVDISKVIDSYWKMQQKQTELQTDMQSAQERLDKEKAALQELDKTFQDAKEQMGNNALSDDAKKKARDDASKLYTQLQEKSQELQQNAQNTENEFKLRQQRYLKMHFDEIKDVILTLSKAKGATIVIDTSGPTALGVSSILYAAPEYDITDEVITEANKTMPADFKLRK